MAVALVDVQTAAGVFARQLTRETAGRATQGQGEAGLLVPFEGLALAG